MIEKYYQKLKQAIGLVTKDKMVTENDKTKYLATNLGIFYLSHQWFIRAGCCMATKCASSIDVYIPVDWCEAFGHDISIVEKWIDFINKALTRNDPAYLVNSKTQDFVHEFPNKQYLGAILDRGYGAATGEYDSHILWSAEEISKTHSTITNDAFYKVVIPADTKVLNYATFVLLRHLWCHSYIPIVKDSFKIASELKISDNKELTAILLAYTIRNYDSYYGLIDVGLKWFYKYVNPVFDKNYAYLNHAFEHIVFDEKLRDKNKLKFDPLVKQERWEDLEKLLFASEYVNSKNQVDTKIEKIEATVENSERPVVVIDTFFNTVEIRNQINSLKKEENAVEPKKKLNKKRVTTTKKKFISKSQVINTSNKLIKSNKRQTF